MKPATREELEQRLRQIDSELVDQCPFTNRAAQLHKERAEVKQKLDALGP